MKKVLEVFPGVGCAWINPLTILSGICCSFHWACAVLFRNTRQHKTCKIFDGETNLTVDVSGSDHPNCWQLDLLFSLSYRLSHAAGVLLLMNASGKYLLPKSRGYVKIRVGSQYGLAKISFELYGDRQIGIWLLQSSICCYGTQYQVMGGKANMEDCVFCKIGSGEIQGLRICEDDEALAFMDISRDYDGHILVIPKRHYRYVTDCPENVACKVWFMAQKVSKHLIEDCGYDGADIMSANSPVSQSLPHFHVHIIPRKIGDRLGNPGEWPTPAGAKEDVRVMHERLKMI